MTRKTRKGKAKFKRQIETRRLVDRETNRSMVASSVSNEKVSPAKPLVTITEPDIRYTYVKSELKRILFTAGAVFAVLIILYIFLR